MRWKGWRERGDGGERDEISILGIGKELDSGFFSFLFPLFFFFFRIDLS